MRTLRLQPLSLTGLGLLLAALVACAEVRNPTAGFTPVANAQVVGGPAAAGPEGSAVQQGRYLVGLLGCASCHTDGALLGQPNEELSLAGSRVGIAVSDPLSNRYPAVIYPSNITPDKETGIGNWTREELVRMLREGMERHGRQTLPVMPWQSYARLTEDDAGAIAAYLMSLAPVSHRVPGAVPVGRPAQSPFVYVGLYRRDK